MKVALLNDSNEFELRSIMIWNGNEDEEGLKEVFEKGEAIEDIRVNGSQSVVVEPMKGMRVR